VAAKHSAKSAKSDLKVGCTAEGRIDGQTSSDRAYLVPPGVSTSELSTSEFVEYFQLYMSKCDQTFYSSKRKP